ncbi:MAG: hypothetical protein JST89_16460 [Cyanobacteria bacterium SZAS-4]|nr:hypothetical protein [Cyanobacteria bacterium SZAS-4]
MSAQIEQRSRIATSRLKRMQSRGWILVAFDNAIFWLEAGFDKFADAMASLMAGILTPKQARSVSVYATAFFIAALVLVFCREVNLYCFRSVAKSDTVSAHNTSADQPMMSTNQNNSTL